MKRLPAERAPADLARLRGRLVVSCQAREDNPLQGPAFMAAMAKAAIQGGAAGIRADGVADVTAIREAIGPDRPIMGIVKVKQPDGALFITPSAASARAIIMAGASLVALNGTPRTRPGGESLRDVVTAIHEAGGAALADIGTVDDARYAVSCGVDAVGSTLSGYTPDSPHLAGPDFPLLEQLVRECSVPVFAEGRIWTPAEARLALDLGAAFVVVGTAITNPGAITARIAAAMAGASALDDDSSPRADGNPAVMPKAHALYFDRLHELLTALREEGPRIEEAAAMMAGCIAAGGVIHVFGSGHSHMMAEEVFHRAGGLFAFNAMLDINLTSFGTLNASLVERAEGYAKVILDSFDIRPGEVVVVVSNSGINPVPIELALEARQSGAQTIAITSATNYRSAVSRHSSGQKLSEVTDLTIDSRVPAGDAILSLAGLDAPVAAASTALGAALMNAIVAQTAEELLAMGHQPPVIVSMNIPGGDERNAALTAQYRPRLRLLGG